MRGRALADPATMLEDLRLSLRALIRNPWFLASTLLILALGIGANVAVFSFIDALLLRALPVERPAELVVLGPGATGNISRSTHPPTDVFSFAQYRALVEDNNDTLAAVAAAASFSTTAYWGDDQGLGTAPQPVACQLVTGAYFPLLGLQSLHGRLLAPSDDGPAGTNPVAVVSHAFWTTRLGADTGAVGSTIRLHNEPYEIVGVAPPAFKSHDLTFRTDIWIPLCMQPQLTRRPSMLEPTYPYETYWLNILGRLKPGVPLARGESAINLRLQQIFLEQAGEGVTTEYRQRLRETHIELTPAARGLWRMRSRLDRPAMLLWAATGFVLLIGCANLGILLLARATERRHEIAIRQALGATRLQLARRLLTESAILGCGGTALGCVLAYWLIPLMRLQLQHMRLFSDIEARLDTTTFGYSAAVGLLTILLAGLLPSLWSTRIPVANALSEGGSSTTLGRRDTAVKGLLVVGQCALCMVLLSTAGLFLKTLSTMRASDLGLDPTNVLAIVMDPRGSGLASTDQPAMRQRILDRVRSLPGVESAAFADWLPPKPNHARYTIRVSGYAAAQGEDMSAVHVRASPEYFATLRIRFLRGRPPRGGETGSVVVNDAFASKFFPDETALGGVINGDSRIVGIVQNVRQLNLRDIPPPIVYVSADTYEGPLRTLAVRSSSAAAGTAEAVRSVVRETVPQMPILQGYETVEALLDSAVAIEKTLAVLVGTFGCVALLLCALGIFGVSGYAVRRRRIEFGIRMALGATAGNVRGLVFRRAAVLLASGAAIGLLGAIVAGRLVSGILYEVGPFDWAVIGWSLLALTAVGALATTVPTLQAGRVQPAVALRQE